MTNASSSAVLPTLFRPTNKFTRPRLSRRRCENTRKLLTSKLESMAAGSYGSSPEDGGNLSLRGGDACVDEPGIAAEGGDLAAALNPGPRFRGGGGEHAKRNVVPLAAVQNALDHHFYVRVFQFLKMTHAGSQVGRS